MKKTFVILVLSALFISAVNINSEAIAANDKGVISVNTTSSLEVSPDLAEISFAVVSSDQKSMQKATSMNKEISDKVLSQLKLMIDPNNGDYIKTSDFSANPVYSYVNSKKIFEKYEVTNRVLVHTKSIDKVGEMIDKAILAGATNVDNLSFSLSDYETQCNELISNATKKAGIRANAIAKSLGSSIRGISSITSSCSTNNFNPPRLYMAKNMIADVASESYSFGSTSISNGVIKINASVNAGFFVK